MCSCLLTLRFLSASLRLCGELRFRRTLIILALLPLFTFSIYAKDAQPLSEDPALDERVMRLSKELRCLVCQNETLADSQADLAADLRREIREQMKQGKSDKEIVDFLVARYGDFVLYRPPVKTTTYLLWFGPFLLLIAGGYIEYLYIKRRRERLQSSAVALTDEERKRAEALLGGCAGSKSA